mgnify:CR=1 FL=1
MIRLKNSWNWLVILYVSTRLTNSEYSACNDPKWKLEEICLETKIVKLQHVYLCSGGFLPFGATVRRRRRRRCDPAAAWPLMLRESEKRQGRGRNMKAKVPLKVKTSCFSSQAATKRLLLKAATTKGQKLRRLLGHVRIALWSSTSLA